LSAPRSDALGRISLLVIIFILFYDTIFSIYRISVNTFDNVANLIVGLLNSLIIGWGGGPSLFPNTEKLITDVLGWEMFLFSNATALAIIVFISIIKMSYKAD